MNTHELKQILEILRETQLNGLEKSSSKEESRAFLFMMLIRKLELLGKIKVEEDQKASYNMLLLSISNSMNDLATRL